MVKKNYDKVLVVISGSGGIALGDALIQLPFLRALRAKLPNAKISVYSCLGGVKTMWPLFENFIDEQLMELPEKGECSFDLVFDLATGGWPLVKRARSLARAGGFYSTWKRGWAHLPNLPIYHGKHVVRRHLGLLQQALGRGLPMFWPWPMPSSHTEAANKVLPGAKRYIGIAPGAGDISGHGKCWPIDRFVAIGERAAKHGFTPVIILGPNESGLDSAFRHISGAIFPLNDYNDVPKDPIFTIALGSRMEIALSNNSGPSHMLALGGCRVVAIFGPTNAIKSVPFAPSATFIRPETGKSIELVGVDAVEKALFNNNSSDKIKDMGCEWQNFYWQNTSTLL